MAKKNQGGRPKEPNWRALQKSKTPMKTASISERAEAKAKKSGTVASGVVNIATA
jgi:hypothetical protein